MYKNSRKNEPIKDDRMIYSLFSAQQILRTYLKNALKSEGIKITPAQAGILFILKNRDGGSMTQLSQALCSDNSTITGLVDRLQKLGFVRKIVSSTDRRISRIYITVEGIDEINRAKLIINKVNEEIKSGFSKGEMEIFKSILDSFHEKFNGI